MPRFIPLNFACQHIMDDTDIVQMLIGHQEQKYRNEQLNALDNSHHTPLDIACSRNNYVAVVEILNHATVIDINIKNSYGETSLLIACSKSDRDNTTINIIQALPEQPSIMIHKMNMDGETSFDIIQEQVVDYPESYEYYNTNEHKQQCLIKIIQLLHDYYIRQRWQIYCYLIESNY